MGKGNVLFSSAMEKQRRELRGLGAEKLWKAMFSNGDTSKTALNAPRMAQNRRSDQLYLKLKKRTGGQNEREGKNGKEGRVLADCM